MAIVRDHDDRAGEDAQRLGQCLAHFQIEMVGRFIKQQHVGFAPGDQGQRQACALAAGEAIDILEGAIAGEVPAAEEVAELLHA